MARTESISLIGMPGAGKSSVGILLAKLRGLRFVDTDLDIQVHAGATLEEILQAQGYGKLRQIEEQVLLGLDLDGAVIATGGSAVYSQPVMQKLKALGPIIYLREELPTLQARVAAAPPRGIASERGQSFADIHAERTPLYERHARHIIDALDRTPAQIALAVMDILAPGERTCPEPA